MVKTGGYLLDVALQRAIDQGWHVGPRIYPAGHAVTPYGGHLDPTVFQRLAPGIMPLSVAEGIANGVDEVRACVRYQIRHGAKLIKVSASGGVMSHSTAPGAQQYSDDEFAAIADEAHRAGVRVAAHAVGDTAIRACIRAGHRLHRARLPGHRRHHPDDGRPRHLPGVDHLPHRGDGDRPHRTRAAQEGGGGVPAGSGDAAQGHRRRRPDRLRHRRSRDAARAERQGVVRSGRPRDDPYAGTAGGDGHQRRARSRPTTNSAGSPTATSPTSSRWLGTRRRTSPRRSTCGS